MPPDKCRYMIWNVSITHNLFLKKVRTPAIVNDVPEAPDPIFKKTGDLPQGTVFVWLPKNDFVKKHMN